MHLNKNKNKIFVIASGSSGNCTYIEICGLKILIDIGISVKKIELALNSINVDVKDIDFVIITHEHIDHVKSLKAFQKKYHKPLYLTNGTLLNIADYQQIINECEIITISQFSNFFIKECNIKTFLVDHDASEPIGITFETKNFKIGLATDLGYVNKSVIEYLKRSNVLLLESNYDVNMLLNGNYPWELKQRIASKKGHLSNNDAANVLKVLNWDGLLDILLMHLSLENNTHNIAINTIKSAFKNNLCVPNIIATYHDMPTECRYY